MANLQVKGIDDDLYHELTTCAKRNNSSCHSISSCFRDSKPHQHLSDQSSCSSFFIQ